jgi:hypothetical protein
MNRLLFNSIYVVLISLAIAATAEAARRRSGIPLRSVRAAVLYLFLLAIVPGIFPFGYAGGAWLGFALAALVAKSLHVESQPIATASAIAGVYLGSYLIGVAAIGMAIAATGLVATLQRVDRLRRHPERRGAR